MLCEKCGNNNPESNNRCSYCGSQMPVTEMCKGFADILTYSPPEQTVFPGGYTPPYTTNISEGISEEDMKKIIRKTDSIISFSRKNLVVSLISLMLAIVIIVCTCLVLSSNKALEKKIDIFISGPETTVKSDATDELKEFLAGDPMTDIIELNDKVESFDSSTCTLQDITGFYNELDNISKDVEKTSKNKQALTDKVSHTKDIIGDLAIGYCTNQISSVASDAAVKSNLKAEITSCINPEKFNDSQKEKYNALIQQLG